MLLRDDLLTPIPGPNPSGENIRYAAVFDKIKEARREDDDAPQGEWQRERKVADYPLIIKLASEAIATKSKDLELAAWLTEALLRREGFAGLNAGLQLIQGLIENFWDTLYPEMEDGDPEWRAAKVEWVGTRFDDIIKKTALTKSGYSFYKYKESRTVPSEEQAKEDDGKLQARETALSEGKLSPDEFEKDLKATSKQFYEALVADLDGCLATIEALGPICEEKFGEATPSFTKTRSALEEVRHLSNGFLKQKRELEPDPVAEASAGDSAAEESSAVEEVPRQAAAPRKVTSAEPVDKADAAVRIAAIAAFLRREDPYNPAPYLMLRGFRWGELRASGYAPDPALFEPPSGQVRMQLKRIAAESDWQQLLEIAEKAMAEPCGRAWLDLQRYVVRACEQLGYDAIATAIKSELRALLADFPDLLNATLMDDTATANSETKAWIAEFAAAPSTQHHAPPSMQDDTPEDEKLGEAVPDSYTLALQAARSGRPQEAIELLTGEISRQNSGRGRFQRKVQLAQLCIQMGYEPIAKSILEELARTVDKHHLEEWESAEVIAHAFSMLYDCMQKLDGDPVERQKLYERICRLDPMQAFAHAR